MAYQPVVDSRTGETVQHGERACTDRYQAIAQALQDVAEPFTVLDLGAYTGWFAQALTRDFDCTVTAVDDHPGLTAAASQRIRVINRRVTPVELAAMPRHDVILALSVLHHFADWRAALAETRRCRQAAFVEVPHPDETWMRHSAARHELPELDSATHAAAARVVDEFPRTGRNGVSYVRPMYQLAGTVTRVHGRVFTGNGRSSRSLPRYSRELRAYLGYEPYPGSLNLRLDHPVAFGDPYARWTAPNARDGRWTGRYHLWRAWLHYADVPVHAMWDRGHGADCVELLAPVRLRDHLNVTDRSAVAIDVETNA
jgi:SAM-dependent methyltransferase